MFAVLHIADFALHAILRTTSDRPFADPAALFSRDSKKSVVLATNPAARATGVELGMTAPQAVARCPALIIRAPHSAAENEARAAQLAVGFSLSPLIEDTAPGVCTADLKGIDPAKLAPTCDAAVRELGLLGFSATAGLARTPLLALYAARHASSAIGNRPSPIGNAQPVLHVTDVAGFLAPLPLAAADPAPELAAVLHNWGLRTLGDLTALPRDEIVRRFGSQGLALWQRASGGAHRPLHPVIPPQAFAAAMEFETEIETLEPLLFILRRFLDRLALELRASQHVAAELKLTLTLEDETQHVRSLRLPEPTADPEILFRALHTHLESLTTAASIRALALALTPARPLVRQQGLFETGLRDPHGFGETLARLSALVGPERVGTPQPEDTHRPDAFKLVPPSPVIPSPAPDPVHPPLGLVLHRFRPPLPVQVNELEGSAYIWSHLIRGEISGRSTPYPTSGDWWQADRAWSRTEWDITLAEGGFYRLLRVGPDYFIEGEYD
ncbi:MAG: DNA polymerase Y family protein [Verrucomicrobiota bacterium]